MNERLEKYKQHTNTQGNEGGIDRCAINGQEHLLLLLLPLLTHGIQNFQRYILVSGCSVRVVSLCMCEDKSIRNKYV